jgi:hypothetical protein
MDTLTLLRRSWGDVIDRIDLRSPIGAMLAKDCYPTKIEGNVITLQLTNTIGVDMLNSQDDGRRVFEEAICHVLKLEHGTYTVTGILK